MYSFHKSSSDNSHKFSSVKKLKTKIQARSHNPLLERDTGSQIPGYHWAHPPLRGDRALWGLAALRLLSLLEEARTPGLLRKTINSLRVSVGPLATGTINSGAA
jgi:hypothetical protein